MQLKEETMYCEVENERLEIDIGSEMKELECWKKESNSTKAKEVDDEKK